MRQEGKGWVGEDDAARDRRKAGIMAGQGATYSQPGVTTITWNDAHLTAPRYMLCHDLATAFPHLEDGF